MSESATLQRLPDGHLIDGRYEICGLLGRGGFATVYEARHVHMGRNAAVKVLDPSRSLEEGQDAERFLREAKIASRVSHPNVVNIYDFGFSGEQPYIAMELLKGYDLAVELRTNGPLSPARAYKLFLPVLDALEVGHRQGVVHKDLKPANLFITDPGSDQEALVVLDFGVARAAGQDQGNLTETGELLGTPKYLAPEYIREQIATPAVDVYQMALIISEALCGLPAVDGNAYTAMMNHCTGKLAIPHVLLNGKVGQVFRNAIEIDHNERLQTAGALGDALRRVEREFKALPPVTSIPTGNELADTGRSLVDDTDRNRSPFAAGGVVTDGHAQPTISGRAPQPAAEEKRRSPLLFVGVGLGAVLLAALVVVLTRGGGESEASAAADTPAEEAASEEGAVGDESAKAESAVDESAADLHFDEGEAISAVAKYGSVPPGATVFINGDERGTTPAELSLEAGKEVELAIVLDGYLPFTTKVTPDGASSLTITLEPEPVLADPPPDPIGNQDVKNGATGSGDSGTKRDSTKTGTKKTGTKKKKDPKKKDSKFRVAP